MLSYINTDLISYTNFEKFKNIKFQENPLFAKEAVECGRMDKEMDKQDEVKTLIKTLLTIYKKN